MSRSGSGLALIVALAVWSARARPLHAERTDIAKVAARGDLKKLGELCSPVCRNKRRAGQAIFSALESQQPEAALFLIQHGADLSVEEDDGTTLLIEASRRGTVPVVEELLRVGAEVGTCSQDGDALSGAIVGRHPDVAAVLLRNGAGVDASCDGAETPLTTSEFYGERQLAGELKRLGASHELGEPERHILPNGYRGLVLIVFDARKGQDLKRDPLNRLYRVPPGGVLRVKNYPNPAYRVRDGKVTRKFQFEVPGGTVVDAASDGPVISSVVHSDTIDASYDCYLVGTKSAVDGWDGSACASAVAKVLGPAAPPRAPAL